MDSTLGQTIADNTISYEPNQHNIYDEVRKCKKCPKGCNLKYGHIFPWNGDGKMLFVAIQPNWNGDPHNRKGTTTIEYALNFNKLRKKYGLDRYPMTNLIKCATTRAGEYPTKEQIYNCLPWLSEEIRVFNTKLIVFVGKGMYDKYHKDIETIFRIKTCWCYHYSRRNINSMGKNYHVRQRERMKEIASIVLNKV